MNERNGPRIIVTVRGGMVQEVRWEQGAPDATVVVRDYDQRETSGERCETTVWTPCEASNDEQTARIERPRRGRNDEP